MNLTLKDKLLEKLLETTSAPISGQQLADEFDVSRTAIWKNIKVLEEEGYVIESIRKKGYQLVEQPDMITAARLQQYLTATTYGRNVVHHMACDSTQFIAHDLAQQGAEDGTVVITEKQLQGKGRLARPWASDNANGLWMSLIMRPDLAPQHAPQLTLVAAVSIVRAIEEVCNVRPVIKWPNDILINDLKVTGILTEMQADPDRVKSVILGIGMNINQNEKDFPTELEDIATSLKIETGQSFDRAQIAATVLDYIENYTNLYLEKGFIAIKLLWESYSNTIGRHIRVTMINEVAEGEAIGITADGMLQLKQHDGTVRNIYSGDITIQS